MGLHGFSEASSSLDSIKKILLKWDKHCNNLQSLADQISGIERCNEEAVHFPKEMLGAVQITINSKILEALQNLYQDMEELEAEHTALVSLLSQALNQSQRLLEKNEQTVSETQALHSLDSLCKQVAVLIAMKKVPLHKASPNDLCSLKEFRGINTLTKSLESEIDRELSRLNI